MNILRYISDVASSIKGAAVHTADKGRLVGGLSEFKTLNTAQAARTMPGRRIKSIVPKKQLGDHIGSNPWFEKMGRRGKIAGGIAGATYGASVLFEDSMERAQAYYGQDSTLAQDEVGATRLGSTLTQIYGYGTAAATMMGITPVQNLIGTIRGRKRSAFGLAMSGVGAAGGALTLYGTSKILDNPETAAKTIGTGGLMIGGAIGFGLARKLGAGTGAMVAGGAGAVAGYAHSMRLPMYPASEGNITSLSDGSAAKTMNFNTAGLVQALHTNRKVR